MNTMVKPHATRQRWRSGTQSAFCSLFAVRRQNLRRRQGRSREDQKAGLPASPAKAQSCHHDRTAAERLRARPSASAMESYAARPVTQLDEEAYALVRRISAIICYIKALHYSKEYLLDVLRTVLKHYPGSKDIRSMAGINRQIRSELAKYGGYEVSRRELKEIWME